MKKKFLFMLLLIVLFNFNISVFASTVTWEQITDEWENLTDDSISVTDDDASLTIVTVGQDSVNYETKFEYANNIINFIVEERDNMTDLEYSLNAIGDDTYIYYMLYIISKLYDINVDNFDVDNYANYGIHYESTPFSYESDGVSLSVDIVTSFYVDLDVFESSTTSLVGTFDDSNDNDSEISVTPVSVSLEFESANSDKLNLIVNVSNLSSSSTASCKIYGMIKDSTGSMEEVATIDSCVNGVNKITVSGLKANTSYNFQVELIENTALGATNQITGGNYKTFSTIDNVTKSEGDITNPKTGSLYIYITLFCLILSAFSIVYSFRKYARENI